MKTTSCIHLDTPIRPRVIAACVCEEASAWLGEPLPRRWIRELAAEAATVYSNCERFRRRVRGGETRGRNYLWMFMRHWLCAKLWERRPWLYSRLPASYASGAELPARRSAPQIQPARTGRIRPVGMHVRVLSAMSL